MEAADIYAWMTARPNLGCDGFDAHVAASILSISLWEAETGRTRVSDAVGLNGESMLLLSQEMFPHTSAVFARWRTMDCSEPTEDEICLRDLLHRFTTLSTSFQHHLVNMMARRCMRPNHLWQDLGLRNRRELGWLMQGHFESLAARNRADMKWKKFFYRTICRDDGYMLCSAPSCSECDDFNNCFGEETGESLLARARLAADLAAA